MVAVARGLWKLLPSAVLSLALGAQAQSTAAVSGVVLNSVTHQPIGRVLVSVSGGGSQLTDSSGRFSFDNVPLGKQDLTARRPGYQGPLLPIDAQQITVGVQDEPHALLLTPLATLAGHVQVPDGDSPAGVKLELYGARVWDGWRFWEHVDSAKARPDGTFRFSNLRPGSYLVYSPATLDPAFSSVPRIARVGYAPVFSPEAHDPSAATVYTLEAGQSAEATVVLASVPFFPVTAHVASDGEARGAVVSGNGFIARPVDSSGPDGALETYLPSGSYTMTVGGGSSGSAMDPFLRTSKGEVPMVGSKTFSVDSGAAPNLSIPLVAQPETTLQVVSSQDASKPSPIQLGYLPLDHTIGGSFNAVVFFPKADDPQGASFSAHIMPGRYWVTVRSVPGYVESLTSAATDLFSQPLSIPAGASVAISATVRSDTGSLHVVLSGDVPVPCFVHAIPLAGGSDEQVELAGSNDVNLSNLAPGDYLVFAMPSRAHVAFREPGVLQQISGRRVSIAAGQQQQTNLDEFEALPSSILGYE